MCAGNAPTIKEVVSPAISALAVCWCLKWTIREKATKAYSWLTSFLSNPFQGMNTFIGTAKKHTMFPPYWQYRTSIRQSGTMEKECQYSQSLPAEHRLTEWPKWEDSQRYWKSVRRKEGSLEKLLSPGGVWRRKPNRKPPERESPRSPFGYGRTVSRTLYRDSCGQPPFFNAQNEHVPFWGKRNTTFLSGKTWWR